MSVETTQNQRIQVELQDGVFEDATLTAGGAETWPAGTVMGRITASGKVAPYDSAAVDGTEVPVAVLTYEQVFAGAGDDAGRILTSGRVRRGEVSVYNGGSPLAITDAEADALRDFSIIAVATRELLEV
jgi:hypothetical protein